MECVFIQTKLSFLGVGDAPVGQNEKDSLVGGIPVCLK